MQFDVSPNRILGSKTSLPLVAEVDLMTSDFDVINAFRIFSGLRHAIFLDGRGEATCDNELNRFSFLVADPVQTIEVHSNDSFDFGQVESTLARFTSEHIIGLPPFQGGLAGFFGYEYGTRFEDVPISRVDDFNTPLLFLGVYDVVLAIDHQQQKAWLISQGWPATDPTDRLNRAQHRIQFFSELLNSEPRIAPTSQVPAITPKSKMNAVSAFPDLELYSDFSEPEFLAAVNAAVHLIHEGDAFQVNLSQRLLTPITKASPELYLDMRKVNPAPFSGYLDFGAGQLISASPERMVCMRNGEIETRPIKGTRARTRYPEADLNRQLELLGSEKDRAENTMIVDLMRNDLSRVSERDSVVVEKLCGLEKFQNVMHLVSVIHSKIRPACTAFDLVQSVFPGGSITGAPKIRAMEIIAELEPTVRGAYCGSLGYIGCNGHVDLSILIRTITAKDGWWQIPVGGGIVSDSKPNFEYQETWTKAVGMLNAICQKTTPTGPSPVPT